MRTTCIFVTVIAVVISMTSGQTITSCVYEESSCGCQTDKGLISLHHFYTHGLSTGISGRDGVFYWNPCRDITKDQLKASCIQQLSSSEHYDCGVHANSASAVKDGQAVFTMKSVDLVRESKVTCICGTSERLVFINEDPKLVYNLDLISKFCCPGFVRWRRSPGLSVGTILLIGFLCVVWTYLLGGIFFQTYVMGAKGKDRIPHVYFWLELASLIADGYLFILSCGSSTYYR